MKKHGQVTGIIILLMAFAIFWFGFGIFIGFIIHAKRVVGC